ncbi:2-C-methyl-D-erythritol 4-phosphate cytidylyltransferase [Lapillicoccus sp.]|uniref:2-C-methyl-D-erythritol 4-phosphate cytidylyltransferase n=1 Tax=Lapillicoccus sp. TaxID=1909287 RepID=UPI0032663C72
MPERDTAPATPQLGTTGVIVVAAGSGVRLGSQLPKALVQVAGRPLVGWAVARSAACPGVCDVVVVAPPTHLDETRSAYADVSVPGVTVHLVAGGSARCDSVAAGLAALPERVQVVLVHDAARGLTPTEQFVAVDSAVRSGHPAVVPGLPVVDTVKQVDVDGVVVATPDRASLRAIQTPQGFRRDVLVRAHARASSSARSVTDDAALVERLGLRVLVVPGHPLAHKITTVQDLHLVEAMVTASAHDTAVPSGAEEAHTHVG